MRLTFSLLLEPLLFEENRINVLIIENPPMLRKALKTLCEQASGLPCEFILSDNDVPQDLPKSVAILIDPLHPVTASTKLNGLFLKEASQIALDRESELHSLLSHANEFAARLSLDMRFPITFDSLEDPTAFLRLFGFRLDSEGLDTPELLLEWMLMQREFLGKQLYIIYGLKSLLQKDELESFYRNVMYEKLNLLLIEPYQRNSPLKDECVTIIDEELCVIY